MTGKSCPQLADLPPSWLTTFIILVVNVNQLALTLAFQLVIAGQTDNQEEMT